MMKIVVIFLLVILFFNCTGKQPENKAVLSGDAVPGETVYLQYNTGINQTVVKTVADSVGNYVLEWPLEVPRFYFVGFEQKGGGTFFVKPGWKIKTEIKDGKLVFQGDGIEQNRFMSLLEGKRKELNRQYPLNMMDPQSYKAATLNKLTELKEYVGSAVLEDTDFKGMLEANVALEAYRSLLDYPMIYQVISNGKTVSLPDDYYDFLIEADFSSPYLANLGHTSSTLQNVFTAMESSGYLKTGLTDYLIKRAERIQDSVVRENYLLYALEIELFGYNQQLGEMIDGLETLIVTPSGKEKLQELKDRYAIQRQTDSTLNAGNPALDFSGIDVTGKKHTLSDFARKVVVVDVWNTGCKPCISEIPFLKKLEKRFAGKDVAFISISLEEGVQKWRDFVKEHDMQGNQWIEPEAFKSSFARHYHIRYIPRFMVFSRTGRVVETYAPKPSCPRLAALIEQELNK